MRSKPNNYFLHILLFLLSVITTTLTGAEMATGKTWFGYGMIPDAMQLGWKDFSEGFLYSFSFLLFLTVHEFGHYFTALYHGVKSSLPYYIPVLWPFPGVLNIGSFGAVIRLRSMPDTTQKFFDIGVAGPLAGFVISVSLLIVGFSTLPEPASVILKVHPEYVKQYGGVPSEYQQLYDLYYHNATHSPEQAWQVYKPQSNLLYEGLKKVFADPSRLPNALEMIHYPLLFVGFLTLFFTALNLLPIGQLDGGHVMYGLFGIKKAAIISRVTVVLLLLIGGTGLMDLHNFQEDYLGIGIYVLLVIYVSHKVLNESSVQKTLSLVLPLLAIQILVKYAFPTLEMYPIWLGYAFMAVRFIGLDHPPAMIEEELSTGRKALGYLAILIFILSFSLTPMVILGEG